MPYNYDDASESSSQPSASFDLAQDFREATIISNQSGRPRSVRETNVEMPRTFVQRSNQSNVKSIATIPAQSIQKRPERLEYPGRPEGP